MRFRFLYLNEAGEEVEVGGLEELRSCIAMGRVDENTLLYDSVTREWAPARAHSAFRSIAAEDVDDLMGPGDSPFSLETEPESGSDHDLPTLTPHLETDFDPVEAFLSKRERERRLDVDEPEPDSPDGFHMVEPGDELADRSADPVPSPPRPDRPPVDPVPAPVLDDEPDPAQSESSEQKVVVPRIPSARPPQPIRRSPVGRSRRRLAVVAGVAVAMVGVWAIFLRGGAEAGDLPAAVRNDGPPPPPPDGGPLADRLAEARGSAFGDMVLAMDSVRRAHGLEGGPDGWLDGHYLATASEYPEVEDYWQRYLQFVSELRAQDTVFFRMGFMQRLRDEGLEGPVVSMRLASGLAEFRRSQPTREYLYWGMESLARQALDLHTLLVQRESDVDYDPVQLGTVSRDPVMEAFSSHPDLRDEIWARLDGIFEAMDIVQGGVPGSRDQLGDAALREILESGGRN